MRSIVALLNLGPGPVELQWEKGTYFDWGWTLTTTHSGLVSLQPGEWKQVALQGWIGYPRDCVVRVRRLSGSGTFAVYGVVNDGANPGLGTGDGSYVPMVSAR
jgi:hypothetical protein